MARKKILVFIDWFLPGYKAGGQIPSVANIVKLLAGEIDFYLVTRDTDLGESETYKDIPVNSWIQKYGAKIIYLSKNSIRYSRLRYLFAEVNPDIVYCNSLFSVSFTIYPLLIRKIYHRKTRFFLAPRGMLGHGALQQKALKKRLFLWLAKWTGLYKNINWHASSVQESDEIQKVIDNKASIRTALDLSSLPDLSVAGPRIHKMSGSVNLFFLSRISSVKNLLFGLKMLQNMQSSIEFKIIGPIEDDSYWQACSNIINNLPENIIVQYIGSMPSAEIPLYLIQNCHFLFLPSLSENYGHAIFESLSSGCPVIISNQTPWKDLQDKGIGWDLPLDRPEAFIKVINHCIQMNQEEFDRMSKTAIEYARQIASNPSILESNKKLFE